MVKDFVVNEKHIVSLFLRDGEFNLNGKEYEVVLAGKPVCAKGEPKTDIFVRAKEKGTSNTIDVKITYKQSNADFIENKMGAERAMHLLGEQWMPIITSATKKISDVFDELPLIYCSGKGRTEQGSFTMGWKFELLNKKSGHLSDEIDLTFEEKIDVYAGSNLPIDKRDCKVNGETIANSGIANYIYKEGVDATCAQDVIDGMISIQDYLEMHPNIYYACKALNYRSYKKKYDGDRPLSVFVDWGVNNNKLTAKLIYDKPLLVSGNDVYARLKNALEELNIETTDDITDYNVEDINIIYR